MKVTLNLIEQLENMSAFSLDNEQKKVIAYELEQMLGFMDKVKDVNVSQITNCIENISIDSFTRDDEIESSLSNIDALSNAKNVDGNYFTVPKVVD